MRILIADDDPTIRTILQSALVRLGYKVEVALDGDQAWALLQEPDAPELAILDWKMPGMTGIEICQRLRQRKDAPYVYVVLLTGLDTLDDLVAGLEAGADDYMTKPFKAAELNARLRSGRRVLDLQRELLAAQEQLAALANYDSLTEVWNRRVILERLEQELARTEREHTPLGLILLDIDHFKRINDTLGHSCGDEVLQQVAQRLSETLRQYDCIGRYGGEEFLIVVPNCNLQETFKLAERLRRAISDTPVASAGGPVAVSASFGATAILAEQHSDPKALIVAADRALYRAKGLGRNRVEWGFSDGEGAEELH
jgi:diguanylate cyclase (GGDEF)-like protein